MPRQGNGNYILPAGNPVAPQTLIRSSWANTTMNDLGQALTQSISSDGQTAPSADLPMAGFRHTSVGLAISGTQYARADQDQQNALKMLTSAAMPTANAYTANLALATATFTLGQTVYLIPPASNTGPSTLNVNATGAAVILNASGGLLSSGELVAGVLTPLWWNGSAWAIFALGVLGSLYVTGSTGTIAAATAARLQAVSASEAGNAAYMGFNRVSPVAFAGVLGIDTDNQWKVGGWSMGAVSYKLLHEGNSFVIDTPNASLTTQQKIKSNDITTNRGGISGVLFLGDQSAGPRYMFYDGTEYFVSGYRFRTQGPLTVNSGAGGFVGVYEFQVHTGANKNPTLTSLNGVPSLASINDANTAWGDIGLHGTSVLAAFDNACYLGYAGYRWIAVYAVNGVIQTSDAREKRNIEPSALGLDFIESLNPVSYQRIVGKNEVTRVPDYEEEVPERMDIDGNIIPATTRTIYKDVVTPLPGVRTHYGLIAQDVQRAVAASGVADFGGYIPAEADTPDGLQGLCYTEFIAPLIKSVQELSAKVKSLEAQVGGGIVPK